MQIVAVNIPQNSIKAQNVLTNRFVTIVLSNKLLENPIPIRCMFCGEHLSLAIHKAPKAIIDHMYMVEDCDPLVDVRCKGCKLNYRVAY